jgi:O-antigen/teichoic acid export membrane protein
MRFTIPDFSGVKSHVKPNLILFLPTIAVSIYRTMDKIMLGAMANDAELGYYHVCDNIILVPLALITALGTVMLPRMSNMISQNGFDEKSHKLFDYSITFTMFFSTSICMGIMTVAKEFVLVFFGRGYEKCIILFFIILPSCIFMAFANVIRTQYLLPQKMDKQYIVSLFTGAGVNLTLNIILIPHMASVGAAIGTLTAEIVVCIIQAAYVFEEARIGKNIINAIPYVISGIMMFFALYNYVVPVENTIVALLLKIVMGGVLYLFVLGVLLGIKRIILNRI